MEIYDVYTESGVCECVCINGVYRPLHEEDLDLLGDDILNVELVIPR